MSLRTQLRAIFLVVLMTAPTAGALELTDSERSFIAEHPTIVVGGEMDWPPLDYVENGQYKGAANDYLEELSTVTGIEFKIITGYSWPELMGKLKTKHIDMVPMMYWTETRGQEFNMTLPYITVRHYAFTAGDRKDIKSFRDLNGKTMAVPQGYAHADFLQKNHPGINVLEVPGILDGLDAVLVGEADAIIENTASMAYYTANRGIIGLSPAFQVNFEVNNVHMAVRNDWPELRNILQKALNEIPLERTTQIMSKWTGSEVAAKSFLTAKAEFNAAESAYLDEKRRITACLNVNRMPIEFMRNNEHQGMTADHLTTFSNTLRVQVATRGYNSWQEAYAGLTNNECDIITLALDVNNEKQGLSFSPPYIYEKLALATDLTVGFYEDLRDLPTSKIGYVSGYFDINDLRNKYTAIEFTEFNSIHEALDAVADGQLFGVIDYMPVVNHALLQRSHQTLKISGDFPEYSRGLSIAVSSKDPILASAINKAVEAMPEVQRTNVRRKWVAVSIEKETDYTLIVQTAFAAFILLSIMFARIIEVRKHREEIQRKNNALRDINSQLEQQNDSALHMAYHDQLTGLPNRAKLIEELDHSIKRCLRTSSSLAVLFIDLDRFKPVNDTLGHDVGDKLLREVAKAIRFLLRETDILCRLGGDEFVVVLEPVSDAYSPGKVAQRIIDSIGQTFYIDGNAINIGTSIGIAVIPDDSSDLTTILRCADSAMYTAKEKGRNGYAYFREDMSSKAERRTQIETALRQSLKDQHFSLVFQPIVDLQTRMVVKAEALIRWNHPELGFIPPDEFIPIAEEVGLIVDIGDWVLRKACETMHNFITEGVEINAIAVNLSTVEFLKGDIAGRFRTVLNEYDVRPEQIEIEITERYMLDQAHGAESELQLLKGLGHSISVDDFGTGYSSLSYMKRLPLNVIKIDRAFISNIPDDQNDLAITEAIISLSHSLGYKVVAEGVETKEQLDYLIDKYCNYAQGYYMSKPVAEEDFAQAMQDIKELLEEKDQWTKKFRSLRVYNQS
ncbi:MAG: EAL domain-containing protein [Gammaproteobacteria bacterium]